MGKLHYCDSQMASPLDESKSKKEHLIQPQSLNTTEHRSNLKQRIQYSVDLASFCGVSVLTTINYNF
jgi:hypothetical protein